MLVTDKQELQKYSAEHRLWQGIPGIEVTKRGRIFACFYSGNTGENLGNYAMVVMSEDGVSFTEPIVVAATEETSRCYDACIWIDPLGRLWFIWSVMPRHGVYASICEDPDAQEPVWGDPFLIGHDVMLNKPTVLSTGEWLFPIAVWNHGVRVMSEEYDTKQKERGSFVYRSTDQGKTFEKLGGADVPERDYDEHMVLELSDGRLAMYVRTLYGIGVSYSDDGGRTWTPGEDSGLGGPNSRFFIRRLPSGRVLLINHVNFNKRNNLTALLSEDDGKTWKYRLLLDERDNVSYPDVALGTDGYLYIAYDRERGAAQKSLDKVYGCAREILYAKVTEEDIMAGRLVCQGSKLKCVISKLDRYAGEEQDPYGEFVHMGSRREMFWDDYLVETGRTTAFSRLLQPERKETCFWFDQGWEKEQFVSYLCVVKNDTGYRMYYLPWDHTQRPAKAYLAVIESEDGIHWTRPNLNIYDHPELKENNVVIDDLEDGIFVFYDTNPNCDPQEKYKGIGLIRSVKGNDGGLWCYTSPDGYHFKQSHCLTTIGAFDTLNTVHWADGRYACYLRNWHRMEDGKVIDGFKDFNQPRETQWQGMIRDVRVMYSTDFRNWTEPELIRFDDGKDYPLYTNNISPYPRAPHTLIGFPTRYSERQEWTRNNDQLVSSAIKRQNMEDYEKREGLAVTDCIFMCSHDGKLWHRYNEAFMVPGYEMEHNWVYGDCYPAYELVDSGREVYYMYTKDWHRSFGHPKPLNRYEIRKDGFACYMADGEERILVTKPIVFEGKELHLNFQTSAYGYIYVDVLDISGNPLSGQESFEIYGDNIDRTICLADGTDFSAYAGTPIRLRFRMCDAKIYSMQFQ